MGNDNKEVTAIQVHQRIVEYDFSASQLKLLLRADRTVAASYLNSVVRLLDSLGVGVARLATEVPR